MASLEGLLPEERKRLLQLTSGLDRVALVLMVETGLRMEELAKIRPSDFDPSEGSIDVSGRKVALSQEAAEEILKYICSRPVLTYLLEGRCGKPLTPKWERCVLEKIIDRSME